MSEAGLPSFRADQLSRHYFERHISDPALMTDMPKSAHDLIESTLLPPLVRSADMETPANLWSFKDGARVESVFDALHRPYDALYLFPGGLPFLRYGSM